LRVGWVALGWGVQGLGNWETANSAGFFFLFILPLHFYESRAGAGKGRQTWVGCFALAGSVRFGLSRWLVCLLVCPSACLCVCGVGGEGSWFHCIIIRLRSSQVRSTMMISLPLFLLLLLLLFSGNPINQSINQSGDQFRCGMVWQDKDTVVQTAARSRTRTRTRV